MSDGGKWVCGMRVLQEKRHCLGCSLHGLTLAM